MEISPTHLNRRAWLSQSLMALGLLNIELKTHLSLINKAQAAIDSIPWRGWACWDDAQGRHWAGWLHLSPSSSSSHHASRILVHRAVELPTRGHGVQVLPNGDALVVARRPGDWLLHWPAHSAPRWHWIASGRAFNGHVAVSADGQHCLTTELDTFSGEGRLAVRRIDTGEWVADHATHGQDPHMVLALTLPTWATGMAPQDLWWVANGGIATAIETGRSKREMTKMDASLVCLSADTGACVQQWRLPDARLSVRHLAYHAHPAVGLSLAVALQAEHDEPTQRQSAPLLALLQGRDWSACRAAHLSTALEQPPLQGYGGDVAWLPSADRHAADVPASGCWVVSANKAQALAFYDPQGRFIEQASWPQAGALATTLATTSSQASQLWAAGRSSGAWQRTHAGHTVTQRHACDLRLDNHWVCS
jgi:hypothetical protein